MRNIKIIIEYDGSNYSGWQKQNNTISIQEVIENTIKEITGEDINLIGSGRTDKKVHALGQVANFYTNSTISGSHFRYPINMALPDDIRIIESREVPIDFHSRFNAKKKRYKYLIYNKRIMRPMYRNFSYHVIESINIEEMKKAKEHFIGTYDFQNFMGAKSEVDTTIRTIYDIEIIEKDGFIQITIEGKSFLRHMIRIIVGTLIYIGIDRIKKEDIGLMFNKKYKSLVGPTAPGQGLFLEKVFY